MSALGRAAQRPARAPAPAPPSLPGSGQHTRGHPGKVPLRGASHSAWSGPGMGTAVSEGSTRGGRVEGTEDQREKAPGFLNFMLAVTDSCAKRQEEKREKQKHYFNSKENFRYILRYSYKNKHKIATFYLTTDTISYYD